MCVFPRSSFAQELERSNARANGLPCLLRFVRQPISVRAHCRLRGVLAVLVCLLVEAKDLLGEVSVKNLRISVNIHAGDGAPRHDAEAFDVDSTDVPVRVFFEGVIDCRP